MSIFSKEGRILIHVSHFFPGTLLFALSVLFTFNLHSKNSIGLFGYFETDALIRTDAFVESTALLEHKLHLCPIGTFLSVLFSTLIKKKVSSICTPMLIQGRLERTETTLMRFKWDSV